MLQRTITGVLSAAAVVVILLVRGWLSNIVVAALMAGGMWEMYAAFRHAGHKPVVWPGMVAALLMLPGYAWKNVVIVAPMLVLATMLVVLVVCARKEPAWIDAGISLYPIYTIFLPLALLLHLFSASVQPQGVQLIILVLIIAFVGDTMAYFVGVLCGKHKLCPQVSPKKTVEGAIAGLVGSMAGAAIYLWQMRVHGYTLPGAAGGLLLGLLGGMAGQIGDLSASLVKRHCGIKDFGSIFPGHGGIMDRIDSMLFTLMVVCSYVLIWL